MKFGPVPLSAAQGAVLAHSVAVEGSRLRKGRVISQADVAAMQAAGLKEIIVATLDANDVAEDTAAEALAAAILGQADGLTATRPFTGRVNLIADGPGVAVLDVAALEAINAVHPMITIATVPPWQQMAKGGMVATIKMISYAVPQKALNAAVAAARAGAIRLAQPQIKTASLIITEISGGVGDKGRTAIAGRLEALGVDLIETVMTAHQTMPLAEAITQAQSDLVLILTGSATSDIDDVAPAALRRAGGQITRFGMPVDPGNLLFLGDLAGRPVIGLPGCARAPALNGADWVLSRVACGIAVSSADIAGMGVGGLLKEIPTRPMPRRGG
ncbi:molybdopterin-binding protein [Sulfitobacter mediterraneus]|uniref:molybdopterin-binding protein n=1 Tax=Sulfitobacter mediterraneus TaxID=83219 RepID=UPI00193A9120|nr:molybdopterin-binding protein [Sulfitobacter mediterraneus]MBM1556846.1 molybdopterin-binding protein [Sulfitobacter mediterraneus]MBM1569031.1 molybdopterin-binding protein [Sulfitobacter mediterraneus]MBM1572458.1 molybdopterin-binding protein [Sulfitobacter mediterraneus]MBM1576621.1 molybdopterin-binding protein [Sulfitobacter mediterraneus]MBM1579804.1 molybdopterin-binding protein [Sulfitobacter mediterraneus]